MQRRAFENWLRHVGDYTEGSIRSILSTCQRVERYEGDLDSHFDHDGMDELLGLLDYSTVDERNRARQRHDVPISGNVRNGSATLKSHAKLYWEFRRYERAGAKAAPPGFSRMRPRRRPAQAVPTQHASEEYLLGRIKWLADNLQELAIGDCDGLLEHLSGLSDAVSELVRDNEYAVSADWRDWLHQHLTAARDHVRTIKRKLHLSDDVVADLRDELHNGRSTAPRSGGHRCP